MNLPIQASMQHPIIGSCIYCGSKSKLSDEHVLPYGLGGKLVLKKASCVDCARVTARLEERLLRGQWWPYRKILGVKTRSGTYPKYRPVHLVPLLGEKRSVQVLSDDYPVVIFFEFDTPSLLANKLRPETPFAKSAFIKQIRPNPSRILEDGALRALLPWEKVEYPMNFESSDILRLVAKIAHGYAIHQNGLAACKDYFLPKLILGNGDGALTHVGGCSSELLKPKLHGNELNSIFASVRGDFQIVNIQFFRDFGDAPPIYEAIVGTINSLE